MLNETALEELQAVALAHRLLVQLSSPTHDGIGVDQVLIGREEHRAGRRYAVWLALGDDVAPADWPNLCERVSQAFLHQVRSGGGSPAGGA